MLLSAVVEFYIQDKKISKMQNKNLYTGKQLHSDILIDKFMFLRWDRTLSCASRSMCDYFSNSKILTRF